MSIRKNLKYILLLTLAVLSSSCASAEVNYRQCASFPIGGEKVAEELEKVPYSQFEDFWEWIDRLYKLKQELDLCQNQ